MHDGSIQTLEAVIDLYDRGGIEELIFPLGLSKGEKADLIAFLHTLNGASEQAPVPTLPR
jgi:cytochrome c peroxidase